MSNDMEDYIDTTPDLYDDSIEFEQDFDDSVKSCPNCDTPNQFGEMCQRCINDGAYEEG